ncbi:acyl--CoA ligase [Geomonas sp. RF6]|uniref:class I adenylate-forming enzyme family protein n=1 Tax=Geomonas sp. RF6 TaxID=2897342 RepID=UPI001E2D27E6|nr:class I adenylate-forming enzyme family protein [Geomonas sp. RF6]UFS71098.1 acyl--CoA ligase [Geomonas sp. RF6]
MGEEPGVLVHAFLERQALLRPEKVAYVQDGARYSYGRLNCMANEVARFLLARGVLPGDRIAIIWENSVEYVASYYGGLKSGAVVAPLNFSLAPEQLEVVLQELQPRVVVASARLEVPLHSLDLGAFGVETVLLQAPTLPWRRSGCTVFPWDDAVTGGAVSDPALRIAQTSLASIVYTSGSTGTPKGVMLSHRNIVANTASIVEYLALAETDIQMVVLPFFYVMGKSLLNTHFAVGGTVVVNNRFAFPASVVEQMASEGATGFSGVPSTYAHLLHRSPLVAYRQRLASLRYCTQAGGHMSRDIKVKLLEALPPHTELFVMYGATEASARLTYVAPQQLRRKIDSIGTPIPKVIMRVLDEQGAEVPTGQIGELVAQGPNIMLGYWRDPDGTAAVLDQNGYHTGDLGYMDADGYFYVAGRKDSLLKVGGHRVSPQEIEDVMMATELLLEVVVLGVHDELLGQRLVALAVPLRDEADCNEIYAYCLKRLPRYKLPASIRFVPLLPKNTSGKIDRKRCLEMLSKTVDDAGGPALFAI